jgi:uncharacterized protein YbjT (DUF2867 family)
MFVVAGVSGHTGKVVADTLLAQGLAVRVIVRDANKGEPFKARGAEVAVADLHDGKALTAALKGATGAYVLNPPNMAATNILENAAGVAAALKAAIAESGVGHVVVLSSIAVQFDSGTGPILSARLLEQELGTLKTPLTFLRAAYFMENLLANLHPMQAQGVMPVMFDPAHAFEMVATADIGAVAAQLLREGKAAPRRVELAGPELRTLADAAKVFGAAMHKSLNLAPVPAEAQVGVLKSVGLNDAWAQGYADMNAAFGKGKMVFEGAPRRGLITLERFVGRALQA